MVKNEMVNTMIQSYKEDILKYTPEEIYTKYVMAGDVWVFKHKYPNDWYKKYSDFRLHISRKLGVHFNDIAIAGSGKLGFSINPSKSYKPFDFTSDIDIIIVSQELFYSFWKEYLHDSYSEIGIKNIGKVSFCIFRKYMTLEGFRNNDYYRNWIVKTKGFEKEIQLIFGIENEIHYRIFESWEAAQMYYVSSIQKCKNALVEEMQNDGNNRYD